MIKADQWSEKMRLKVALSICSLGVNSDTVDRIREKHSKESQKSAERGFARSALSAFTPPGPQGHGRGRRRVERFDPVGHGNGNPPAMPPQCLR